MKKYDSNSIFSAIKLNIPEMAISVLEDGIDLNTKNSRGFSPLMMAVSLKRNNIVQVLIDRGADVDCKVQGFTPLMFAAQEGFTDIANILIEANADINEKTNDGLSVLMAAVRDGHIEIIKILLAKGVDVKATTNKGTTALMVAKEFKQKKVIELLEKHLGVYDYGISPELLSKMVVINIDETEKPS